MANFVTPTSGGLRTTLHHLATGYAARGHEVVQVVPGEDDGWVEQPWGRQLQLRGVAVPGTGYRLMVDAKRVQRALSWAAPDVLEVHDRTTLRGLGSWARGRDVRSLVVSHERADRLLHQWLSSRLPLDAIADRSNAALARGFDTVVCTTGWAGEEFRRLGVAHLATIPLGVDLDAFTPRLGAGDARLRLVLVSRLSKEKRCDLVVEAVRELCRRGVDADLVVAGDGPERSSLQARAGGLPVQWRGFVRSRAELADLLRQADVALAPGPVETFGLAALEALACGTPVVVNRNSALPEVVGDAGRASASSGFVFADTVQELLEVPERERRVAARQRAELFTWSRTVEAFLGLHHRHRLRRAS